MMTVQSGLMWKSAPSGSVWPPSTKIVVPVMQEASSEADLEFERIGQHRRRSA